MRVTTTRLRGRGEPVTDVAIIGPGRVGTLLTVGLVRAGHRVVAVGGGTTASRARLTSLVAGIRAVEEPTEAARRAELVVLTVPDDALEEVATGLAVSGAVGDGQRVVHVAGSRGLDVLDRAALAGARTAACHPAMTVPAGSSDPDVLVGAAWAVTAREADLGWARELVTDLGGDPQAVPDEVRTLYHAGLAVGSNAVGAAVAVARRLLLAARVDAPEAFLGPLVRASVDNVLARGAVALTGPVVRGDVGTVSRHLAAIEADLPELAADYRALAAVTLDQVRPALPADTAAALDALLRSDGGHAEG